MDFKKDIILPSWEIIEKDSKAKKFYLLPWALGIIFLTALLVYQSVYTYVIIAGKKSEAFQLILRFLEKDYFFEIAITATIFLLLFVFLTPIFEWGLIKYIHQRDKKGYDENISSSDVFWVGLFKFLPIFEYDQMFNKFKLISILNFYLFTIRILDWDYIKETSYLYWIIFIFSIFFNMFFSYSKYEIVLWNKWVFDSIWSSAKITILNLKTTVKLYFMILVLNFRVILNFILLLLFPMLIAIAIWYFTTQLFLIITLIVLTVLFVALILFLSYLSAVLEVFTTSLRYYAWKHSKLKLDDVEK